MCSPRVAAASWAGMRAAPVAVNCQALSVASASRAIRRQIKVATEPVMSRSGPMAAARMAAHSPAGPAGCRAAAAGRLLRPAASAVPHGELAGEAGVQGDALCEQRADRGGGGEHGHQVERRPRGWAAVRRAGWPGSGAGEPCAERADGDGGDQEPGEP